MSLAIRVDMVKRVLLADGWHLVQENSFDLDAYEYIDSDDEVLHKSGQAEITSIGARWLERGGFIMCPLTSVLAIQYGYAN